MNERVRDRPEALRDMGVALAGQSADPAEARVQPRRRRVLHAARVALIVEKTEGLTSGSGPFAKGLAEHAA